MIDLEQLQAVNPEEVDKSELVDIQDISVANHLSKEERIVDFINKIKNPYVCKCGDIVIQSVFEETEKTLTDCLVQYLRME